MPSKYPFGRDKDKPLNECGKGSLVFYVKNLKLGNPKYDAGNIALAKECLTYLDGGDIFKIVEEIEPQHPAFNMCNDAINAKTDAKRRPKPNVSAKSDSADVKGLLSGLESQIKAIYDAATDAQSLIDVYKNDGTMTTENSEHSPF